MWIWQWITVTSFIKTRPCILEISEKMSPNVLLCTMYGLAMSLTFWSQNLISSSLSQLYLSCKFGEIPPERFITYRVDKPLVYHTTTQTAPKQNSFNTVLMNILSLGSLGYMVVKSTFTTSPLSWELMPSTFIHTTGPSHAERLHISISS